VLREPEGIETFDDMMSKYHSGEYDMEENNLSLLTNSFYEHVHNFALLSAPFAVWLYFMLTQRYKFEVLPIFHTLGYRHILLLDWENKFGLGPSALISFGGSDKK
jgi:hypothetical protein